MSGRLYLDEIYSKSGQTKVLDTTSFDANNNFEASNTGFNLNYQSANAALNVVQSGTGDALRVNSNALVVDASGKLTSFNGIGALQATSTVEPGIRLTNSSANGVTWDIFSGGGGDTAYNNWLTVYRRDNDPGVSHGLFLQHGYLRFDTNSTLSNLNSNAPAGSVAYVNDENGNLFYKNDSDWISITAAVGTQIYPASSVQEIKTRTGTTSSGYYWIYLNNTPREVWCDMSGSTAWMLAMRGQSGGSTFGYSSAYWTNTSNLNEKSDPLTNTPIKNGYVWQYWSTDEIRITGSTSATNYTANPVTFTGFNKTTLYSIFNGGTNIYDGQIAYGRGNWINWGIAAAGHASTILDNQPNCNFDGINVDRTYHQVRLGISFNNENDCATNDSGVGFGQYRNGLTELDCGSIQWNPDTRHGCHGWIWVR